VDRNLYNRPAALNIYLIPSHNLNEAAGLNRLISLQLSWRHSAPAAFFVDKWMTETATTYPQKLLLLQLVN
jgi:hypothetical protein